MFILNDNVFLLLAVYKIPFAEAQQFFVCAFANIVDICGTFSRELLNRRGAKLLLLANFIGEMQCATHRG